MFKLNSNPLNKLAFDLIKHRTAVEDSSQFHYSGASAQNLSSCLTWKDNHTTEPDAICFHYSRLTVSLLTLTVMVNSFKNRITAGRKIHV